jgi:hypothetical protein
MSSPRRFPALVVFLSLFEGVFLPGACVETRRSLGEDCLKDDDCLSGVCAQLHCAALPPTHDASLAADGAVGNAVDAAPIEAQESGDGPLGSSPDDSMDVDGSGD